MLKYTKDNSRFACVKMLFNKTFNDWYIPDESNYDTKDKINNNKYST